MRIFLITLKRVLAVGCILVLAGCSTIPGKATRDDTYTEKLSAVRVVWNMDKTISTQLQSTTGRPTNLTYEQRADFARATATIQKLIREEGPTLMSDAMREKGVTVTQGSNVAKVALSIESLGGRAECTPMACAYQLALRANLIDTTSNRTVFSNVFFVGPPWPTSADSGTVKSFVSAVISDIQRSYLFP